MVTAGYLFIAYIIIKHSYMFWALSLCWLLMVTFESLLLGPDEESETTSPDLATVVSKYNPVP